MNSSNFKSIAVEKLSGKWGKAACITLSYMLIIFVMSFVNGLFDKTAFGSILSIVILIIDIPLSLGFISSLFKLYINEEIHSFDFLTLGFNNFSKAWGICLQILLKMIWPIALSIIAIVIIIFGISLSLNNYFFYKSASDFLNILNNFSFGSIISIVIGFVLLIISYVWTIMKSYYYKLAYFVFLEKPDISCKDAVAKSEKLMTRKRGKLFVLELSFIGWAILGLFTLFIGYLWLLPYIELATIAFYKSISDNNSINNEENNISNEN